MWRVLLLKSWSGCFKSKSAQELVDPSGTLMPTMIVEGQSKLLHALTLDRNFEGIVANRQDSRYQPDTRSADWLKIKHFKMIDCVILGYRLESHFVLEEKKTFLGVARQIHT